MEAPDYFDMLYQGWSLTTGADNSFWMIEAYSDNSGRNRVYSVSEEDPDSRKLIASDLSEKDAGFITAIHGSLPDMVRCLLAALDEADRADTDRDTRECVIAELAVSEDAAQAVIEELSARVSELQSKLETARADANFWRYQ